MKFFFLLRSAFRNNWLTKQIRYENKVFIRVKKGSILEKEKNFKMNLKHKIRDNLEKAYKNVTTNTPRLIGGLMILFSIPQFKLLYDILQTENENPKVLQKTKTFLDWYNVKSAFLISAIFGLEAVKFIDKRAKYVVTSNSSKRKFLILLIPFTLNLISASYLNVLDKKIIFGNVAGNIGLFLTVTMLATEGVVPYWLYNMHYHILIFDIVNLCFLYYTLKNLCVELETKPHKFVDIEKII